MAASTRLKQCPSWPHLPEILSVVSQSVTLCQTVGILLVTVSQLLSYQGREPMLFSATFMNTRTLKSPSFVWIKSLARLCSLSAPGIHVLAPPTSKWRCLASLANGFFLHFQSPQVASSNFPLALRNCHIIFSFVVNSCLFVVCGW